MTTPVPFGTHKKLGSIEAQATQASLTAALSLSQLEVGSEVLRMVKPCRLYLQQLPQPLCDPVTYGVPAQRDGEDNGALETRRTQTITAFREM